MTAVRAPGTDLPVPRVQIVGAGLAGSEAALVLSASGTAVDLHEMRPGVPSPAHQTGWFAELVCSNSLGADRADSGKGLLKAELRALGSNLLHVADRVRVPAGKALAVDREAFARSVTEEVRARREIRVIEAEAKTIPDGAVVIIACGPIPSQAITQSISDLLGGMGLYFYDAISPIVDASSLDMGQGFFADRYGSGPGDYLNFPMTQSQYETFLAALLSARVVPAGNSRRNAISNRACPSRFSPAGVRRRFSSVPCGRSACGIPERGTSPLPWSSFARKTRRGRCTASSGSRRNSRIRSRSGSFP